MKLVHVKLVSVHLLHFAPRDMSCELVVKFYDGKERAIKFKVHHIESEKTSAEIISKIRKYEQSLHQAKDSETILDSIVSITIANYPEAFEKLYGFIGRVQQRVEHLKSGKSEGYISTILALSTMKLEF